MQQNQALRNEHYQDKKTASPRLGDQSHAKGTLPGSEAGCLTQGGHHSCRIPGPQQIKLSLTWLPIHSLVSEGDIQCAYSFTPLSLLRKQKPLKAFQAQEFK
jgi:hypothetical protein